MWWEARAISEEARLGQILDGGNLETARAQQASGVRQESEEMMLRIGDSNRNSHNAPWFERVACWRVSVAVPDSLRLSYSSLSCRTPTGFAPPWESGPVTAARSFCSDCRSVAAGVAGAHDLLPGHRPAPSGRPGAWRCPEQGSDQRADPFVEARDRDRHANRPERQAGAEHRRKVDRTGGACAAGPRARRRHGFGRVFSSQNATPPCPEHAPWVLALFV